MAERVELGYFGVPAMKKSRSIRGLAATGRSDRGVGASRGARLCAILLGIAVCACGVAAAAGQSSSASTTSMTQSLLDKAHSFEVRNRMDLAAQTWQQVLLADPKNVDALAGLARAAKLAGNTALAETYLDRLRAINPRDPNIARVQTMMSQQNRAIATGAGGKRFLNKGSTRRR